MPKDLNDILNWRRISANVTTSGQPSETQLEDLRNLGVTRVINLGPHDNRGALPDEPGSLARLGITYTYIPVDFYDPTDADFDAFCAANPMPDTEVLHVHCIYNARVSAFFLRYAEEGRGGSVEEARVRVESIWRPGEVWAKFLGRTGEEQFPNRYAGADY